MDADHLETLNHGIEPEPARMLDDVPERDQHRPEKGEQAEHRSAGQDRCGADLVQHPHQRRRRIGTDFDGLVRLADLAEQAGRPGVRADDLAAALTRRAVKQPGADRVHPADVRDVEDEIAALEPVEPLRQWPQPREGEIAGEAQHAPAVFLRLAVPGHRTHERDML